MYTKRETSCSTGRQALQLKAGIQTLTDDLFPWRKDDRGVSHTAVGCHLLLGGEEL